MIIEEIPQLTLIAISCILDSKAIRKHPYGDEANDWEGVCIPSPIRTQESNFASLVAGAPFGLKAEI
jgi:hypothetical protein